MRVSPAKRPALLRLERLLPESEVPPGGDLLEKVLRTLEDVERSRIRREQLPEELRDHGVGLGEIPGGTKHLRQLVEEADRLGVAVELLDLGLQNLVRLALGPGALALGDVP